MNERHEKHYKGMRQYPPIVNPETGVQIVAIRRTLDGAERPIELMGQRHLVSFETGEGIIDRIFEIQAGYELRPATSSGRMACESTSTWSSPPRPCSMKLRRTRARSPNEWRGSAPTGLSRAGCMGRGASCLRPPVTDTAPVSRRGTANISCHADQGAPVAGRQVGTAGTG